MLIRVVKLADDDGRTFENNHSLILNHTTYAPVCSCLSIYLSGTGDEQKAHQDVDEEMPTKGEQTKFGIQFGKSLRNAFIA